MKRTSCQKQQQRQGNVWWGSRLREGQHQNVCNWDLFYTNWAQIVDACWEYVGGYLLALVDPPQFSRCSWGASNNPNPAGEVPMSFVSSFTIVTHKLYGLAIHKYMSLTVCQRNSMLGKLGCYSTNVILAEFILEVQGSCK